MNSSVNSAGRELFQSKGLRSFRRSRKLLNRTFKEKRTIEIGGQATQAIKAEKTRYENILKSIGYALHFYDFDARLEDDWVIINDTLSFDRGESPAEMYDFHEFVKLGLTYKEFEERQSSNPDVFRYYYGTSEAGDTVYKLVFYGDFIAYLKSGGDPFRVIGLKEVIKMIKETA